MPATLMSFAPPRFQALSCIRKLIKKESRGLKNSEEKNSKRKRRRRRRIYRATRFGAVMHDVGDGMLVLSCSNKRKNRGHGRTPTTPGEEMARNREVVACETR